MKKRKSKAIKPVKHIATGTAGIMGMAGGSMALGAIGGGVAAHGQQGLLNVSRYAPAAGHVIGAGMTIRLIDNVFPNAKKKRR